MSIDPNSRQVGGDHYQQMSIQPWDFINGNGIPYLEGCAIKYIARHQRKGGADDLRKAIHFIEKRLACMGEPVGPTAGDRDLRLGNELRHLIAWQGGWSQQTFGVDELRGPVGPLKHMAKEIPEVINAIMNGTGTAPEEFADIFLLLLDAIRRYGMTVDDLVADSLVKMGVNVTRKWATPTSDEPVEHDRSVPDQPPGKFDGIRNELVGKVDDVAWHEFLADAVVPPDRNVAWSVITMRPKKMTAPLVEHPATGAPSSAAEAKFEAAVTEAAGGDIPRTHPSPAQQVADSLEEDRRAAERESLLKLKAEREKLGGTVAVVALESLAKAIGWDGGSNSGLVQKAAWYVDELHEKAESLRKDLDHANSLLKKDSRSSEYVRVAHAAVSALAATVGAGADLDWDRTIAFARKAYNAMDDKLTDVETDNEKLKQKIRELESRPEIPQPLVDEIFKLRSPLGMSIHAEPVRVVEQANRTMIAKAKVNADLIAELGKIREQLNLATGSHYPLNRQWVALLQKQLGFEGRNDFSAEGLIEAAVARLKDGVADRNKVSDELEETRRKLEATQSPDRIWLNRQWVEDLRQAMQLDRHYPIGRVVIVAAERLAGHLATYRDLMGQRDHLKGCLESAGFKVEDMVVTAPDGKKPAGKWPANEERETLRWLLAGASDSTMLVMDVMLSATSAQLDRPIDEAGLEVNHWSLFKADEMTPAYYGHPAAPGFRLMRSDPERQWVLYSNVMNIMPSKFPDGCVMRALMDHLLTDCANLKTPD